MRNKFGKEILCYVPELHFQTSGAKTTRTQGALFCERNKKNDQENNFVTVINDAIQVVCGSQIFINEAI